MDKEPNGYKCFRCDADLFGQRRKWCDSLCHNRAKKNTKQTWEEHLASLDANASNKFWCECCHKQFKQSQSGTNKKAGHKVRFCSMTCRVDHGKTVRDERLGVRRLWLNNNKAQRLVARQIAKKNAKPEPPKPIKPVMVKHCPLCGDMFHSIRAKYCSDRCSRLSYRETPVYKAHKKAWRLKRKAMDRGATVADKFNPFKVFDRDGWKCQICGIKTPKFLRGTYKPNAPELDHIVPISKGGQHTMTNAQTSCRSCNATKSNGAPIGQMGLFTSLIGA